jgi:hypothetical protein
MRTSFSAKVKKSRSQRSDHHPGAPAPQAMQRNPMWVVALSWDCDERAAGR